MFDYVLRGGTVVDGTGSAGFVADVAIADGRIAKIGSIPATDTGTDLGTDVDVTGMIVAPGFIDPHTHYDAQLFWDPRATPSNLHGVTTAIMGNCGFTLAPIASEADADYLRKMMVKVEGMPLEALENGVSWDWQTFGEYLARLDGNVGINVAAMVGHCALRRLVMGDDATSGPATAEQIEAMKELLAASLAAGGLGFSTTRSYTHNDGSGSPVPSRHADEAELLALCEVVAQFPGTTLEWASDGCLSGFSEAEVDLMANMSLAAQRPINWNVLTVDSARPDDYRNQLDALDKIRERGASSIALTMPVLVGMNMSFLTYCGLNMMPGWGDVLGLPVDERMEKLRDPAVRQRLHEGANSPEAGVFTRLAGWQLYRIGDTFSDANAGLSGRLVGDIAAERGASPFDTLVDIVLADDLQTVLWPGPTDDDTKSWEMRQAVWDHPDVIIGGSDAGAHLDRMSGAPYTTAWLGDSLRGKKLASLESTVHHLTQVPARLFGLTERGVLREGWHADVVVFDPETVDAGPVTMAYDLPGGAKRLVADAVGVRYVFVNGRITLAAGEVTDEIPGTVLRSGSHTHTVSIPAQL